MQEQILKPNYFLEKTQWQRKTYPLKLNLNIEQVDYIDMMFLEYKKAINKAIEIITNKVFPNFKEIKESSQTEKARCPLCKATKNLSYVLTDFKVENYKIGDKEVNRVLPRKGSKTKVCNCFLGKSSTPHKIMRKFVMPSSNRDILPDYDFTVFGELYHKELIAGKGIRPSIYDSCLQKAMECIKSQIEINKRIDYRIKGYEKSIENKKDYMSSLLTDERKENRLDSYSIPQILRFIKKDKKRIDNLKKRKATKIEYKNDAVRLYENMYHLIKEDDDFFIEFKNPLNNLWLKLRFFGEEYQKKLAEKFLQTNNCETEIIRRKGDYYLQYVYKKELNLPVIDSTFSKVEINIGLNSISFSVFENSKRKKVKFYNFRPMWRKRRQFDKIRKIWQKRKRLKKVKNSRYKEINYVNYLLHNLSTDIVYEIKHNVNKPYIVLQDLKYIRDYLTKNFKKIKKESIEVKKIRKINWKINRWNFSQFQKMVEYKANWLGIPAIFEKIQKVKS